LQKLKHTGVQENINFGHNDR